MGVVVGMRGTENVAVQHSHCLWLAAALNGPPALHRTGRCSLLIYKLALRMCHNLEKAHH